MDAFYRVESTKGNLNCVYLSGFHRCAQGQSTAEYEVAMWRNIPEMTLKFLNNGHTAQFACAGVVRERDIGELIREMRTAREAKPD